MRLGAGRLLRLTHRRDIARVFDHGRRANDGVITLLAVAAETGHKLARVGVAVSKRHGGAVQRNRIKRLCREAFRLVRPELPQGFDYMILPRAGAEMELQRLQRSIGALAPKVAVAEEEP